MSRLTDLIKKWEASPDVSDCLTGNTTLLPRNPSYEPLPDWLDLRLVGALQEMGIPRLYTHQAAAAQLAHQRKNVVLVTPTASGKTLAYNLPVLQQILEDDASRALYIFPTKALTQDQYTGLYDLIEKMQVPIATHTFDGDTPADARQAIREMGHIVLTNPDMLHSGILPHHPRWMKLFRNLRYVVLDEMHTYRGVFGSHMANVLRRLRRIARFHGSDPTFVLCSATIANPRELAESLLEEPVELVDRSGAPAGGRRVLLFNPPVVNKQLGVRANYIKQARNFALELVREGVSTIVFASSRLNVELLVKYLREAAEKQGLDPSAIQGYRGGYLPNRRRDIEKGLKNGKITCVVATNALELGIDIGSLDAAVVAGYPGSHASLLQQWGRAGRKGGVSLALYVARSSPMDQYVVNHPEYLLEGSPEEARIDADNPFILGDHLKCALFELPIAQGETFGALHDSDLQEILTAFVNGRVAHRVKDRVMWSSEAYPASAISLRNIPGENFVVIDKARETVVAEVDFVSAHTMLHENAIHNVDGIQYHVKRLDYEGRKAYVEQAITDYYTDAENYVEVRILQQEEQKETPQGTKARGEVTVTEKVVGYKKIRFYTNENVGYGQVSLPELTLHTMASWVTIPASVLAALPYGRVELADAIMGVARALHVVAAVRLMCSTHDIGHCVGDESAEWFSISGTGSRGGYAFHEEAADEHFAPTIFLFDRRPGGVGLSPRVYDLLPAFLKETRDLIRHCGCSAGCPSCIGPSSDQGHNPKTIGLELLEKLVETPP